MIIVRFHYRLHPRSHRLISSLLYKPRNSKPSFSKTGSALSIEELYPMVNILFGLEIDGQHRGYHLLLNLSFLIAP